MIKFNNLNNNSKRIMKALSVGVVSLGLLAGIGAGANTGSNAHAMTAEQAFNDKAANEALDKDEARDNAIDNKLAKSNLASNAKLDQENTAHGYTLQDYAKDTVNAVKESNGSITPKEALETYAKTLEDEDVTPNKANKEAKAYVNKTFYHANRHDKNIFRNHKARRASKRAKKSKQVYKHYRNKRAYKKSHRKSTYKSRISEQQTNQARAMLKRDKKALKSKKARRNSSYRKLVIKNEKLAHKLLK